MNWYIYKITNLINGKSYVGQHMYDDTCDDNYMGSGTAIKRAYKKYGIQNFKKEILFNGLTSVTAANIFEEYFIKKEETLSPNGYNLLNSCMQGRVFSEESRKKMSESAKHRPPISQETRKNISEAVKKWLTPEMKLHLSMTTKKSMTDARRKYNSETCRGKTK